MRGEVPLHPHAADSPGAVVRVEVRGELRVLRLECHRLDVGDMLLHVRAGAEQSLLFAAPQRDTNGSARLDARRLENPRRFHHRGASGGVVSGAGRVRMRIEVGAEDHDFRREIGARQIGDRVESVHVRLVVELRVDVQLDFHRHAFVEHADHPVVVLDGDRHARDAFAGVLVARRGTGRKDRAAVGVLLLPREIAAARRHVAVAAAIELRDRAFGGEKLRELLAECRGGLLSATSFILTASSTRSP